MLPEPIKKRLERLDNVLQRLEEIKKSSQEEFLNDWRLQDISLRNLQVAVECCLDIGTYLLSHINKELPDTYIGVVDKLGATLIIDKETVSLLKEFVKLRNIIVHEYLAIDYPRVYTYLQRTNVFKNYAKFVIQFLEKNE